MNIVKVRQLHLLSPGTKPVSDWAHHPVSLLVLAICPSARSKSFLSTFFCYSSNPSNLSALPICCPKHNKNPLSSSSALSFLWADHLSLTCYTHLQTSPPASDFSLLIQSASCTTASYWKPKSDHVLFSVEAPSGPYCDFQDPLWSGPCFPHQPQGPAS